MMEIWKDIENYEGRYRVSNLGKIKSLQRMVEHGKKGLQNVPEKILKPSIIKGYKCVILCKEDIKRFHQVHILVAVAYVENPEQKPYVNHKDADKLNCAASNLEWNTFLENQHHARDLGLLAKKITAEDVLKIRELSPKMKHADLAILFNVHKSTIGKILLRQIWAHV